MKKLETDVEHFPSEPVLQIGFGVVIGVSSDLAWLGDRLTENSMLRAVNRESDGGQKQQGHTEE